ncbi:hypothetical protein [Streptomyces sp. NPDC086010]|uniref:hypothetical protein n=1 Tax=Streptomyces sp. NPDC086010 TaxID=3365745 RepID=UPI0037D074B3
MPPAPGDTTFSIISTGGSSHTGAEGREPHCEAAVSCRTSWSDSNTYAAQCSGTPSTKFYAWAECNNGQIVFGTSKYANGSQSYAYCAGKGGFTGYGGWVV